MKFLFYEGRHGERILTEHSHKAWDFLIEEMANDDGMTLAESREQGFWVDGGTFEEGYVSADDGGRISTIELTEIQ